MTAVFRRLGRFGLAHLLEAVAPTEADPRVALGAAGREFRHLVDGWPAVSIEDVRWDMTLAARFGRPLPRADRPSPPR